jgi:HAD superfamily hydrolase (TIGR01509 family)
VSSDIAALFDLDGVIVDSRPYHLAAWELLAEEAGLRAEPGYFQRTFGLRNDAILGGLAADAASETLRRMAERKEALFRERARGNVAPLPGARELIESLRAERVPLAVVTSTPRANLEMIIESLRLSESFDALVAEEDASRGKPDPEGFLVAAERVGVAPAGCTVLEDAPAGIEAAKRAGMMAIGVTTTRPAADLAGADLVVESLGEEVVRTFIMRPRMAD